ncbi:group II intron reverse transcriptase/maturase, partial [Neobacillus sedimentimangrovi]|nr:group II intron reverse transcriptase/maturase [Neobacillus sedimentimangrovi]
ALEWGNTRKKYWRIACSSILHKTLDNSYWKRRGLRSLFERYQALRHT